MHCDYGLQCNQRHLISAGSWPNGHFKREQEFNKIWDDHIEHGIECHGLPDNRVKSRNGKYNGPFAFTLTMSPSDGKTVDDMIHACKAVMEQKSQPVKKYAWYLEYKNEETKQHPHIHGMYETLTGRRIEKKHWVRKWDIWDENIKLGQGFRGGYHRPVNFDESYSKYIAKQGGLGETHGLEA